MTEVFLVMQTKQNPQREVVVAVCASRRRAEKFVNTETAKSGEFQIVVQKLLH